MGEHLVRCDKCGGIVASEHKMRDHMEAHSRQDALEGDKRDASALLRATLAMYLGERCKFCPKTFDTIDDLRDVVYAGYHDHGRLACKSCWDEHNPPPNPER